MQTVSSKAWKLVPQADVQAVYAERTHMFIFERTKSGVFQMEGLEPGMVYNIDQCNTIHLVGGCADVEVIKQPNEDSSASMSQSFECSPAT